MLSVFCTIVRVGVAVALNISKHSSGIIHLIIANCTNWLTLRREKLFYTIEKKKKTDIKYLFKI